MVGVGLRSNSSGCLLSSFEQKLKKNNFDSVEILVKSHLAYRKFNGFDE